MVSLYTRQKNHYKIRITVSAGVSIVCLQCCCSWSGFSQTFVQRIRNSFTLSTLICGPTFNGGTNSFLNGMKFAYWSYIPLVQQFRFGPMRQVTGVWADTFWRTVKVFLPSPKPFLSVSQRKARAYQHQRDVCGLFFHTKMPILFQGLSLDYLWRQLCHHTGYHQFFDSRTGHDAS